MISKRLSTPYRQGIESRYIQEDSNISKLSTGANESVYSRREHIGSCRDKGRLIMKRLIKRMTNRKRAFEIGCRYVLCASHSFRRSSDEAPTTWFWPPRTGCCATEAGDGNRTYTNVQYVCTGIQVNTDTMQTVVCGHYGVSISKTQGWPTATQPWLHANSPSILLLIVNRPTWEIDHRYWPFPLRWLSWSYSCHNKHFASLQWHTFRM